MRWAKEGVDWFEGTGARGRIRACTRQLLAIRPAHARAREREREREAGAERSHLIARRSVRGGALEQLGGARVLRGRGGGVAARVGLHGEARGVERRLEAHPPRLGRGGGGAGARCGARRLRRGSAEFDSEMNSPKGSKNDLVNLTRYIM